ncbi:MAG TPA: sodium:solute symporter [Saprospiraceae bacterium]|jgi:Na+/proline symporter|nr:sodium:solute symporter [Saprospiraceae bacterium]
MKLTPPVILAIMLGYFLVLIVVSYFTSRNKSTNLNFFLAGRQAPWPLVAFGMIGSTISGITFISVPGAVGGMGANEAFSYFQVVLGYMLGYVVIAFVLLPLYYRLHLTSIYGYLEQRFGFFSYKTGAAYFLLSRSIGSALRLFLVAVVVYNFVLKPMGVPFALSVFLILALIWTYTFKGGIKTIIVTDALQTAFLLGAVILTVIFISQSLDLGLGGMMDMVSNSKYSKTFYFEGGWSDPNNFFKQFFSGALITITMTGLDQDMMQKNLSCRNLGDAQKNMLSFSTVLIVVNLLFLTLGALLYIYASSFGVEVPAKTDQFYPMIALEHLSPIVGILFILGLTAAAYSSADSAMAALTTSFCVDFLNFEKKTGLVPEEDLRRTRIIVHLGVTVVMFVMILIFETMNDQAVITKLFQIAGYTYGPLLGLFVFGMTTRLKVRDHLVMVVCILAPIFTFGLDTYSTQILAGFKFGFLTIALNGLLTYLGLLAISYWDTEVTVKE